MTGPPRTPVGSDAGAGLRLAFGTLSVLPVHVRRVDRAAARWAMTLAPVVGIVLAAVAAGGFAVAVWAGTGVLVASVLAVALLAAATRGLHLDGLADVADGLGPGRAPAGALAVLRQSDIGPFGVLALVFVTLGQIACLAQVSGSGDGPGEASARAAAALATTLWAGRAAIALGCLRGVAAARPDGLGAMVAGTVPRAAWAVTTLAGVVGAAAVGHASGIGAVRGALALLAGVVAAALMLQHTRRRLGGVTGDVLGALAETAQTAALLVLSTS